MLFLCGKLGMDGGQYQAVEYTGEAITALNMQERMTLSNMATELGAQAGLIAPDSITSAYLASVGVTVGEDLARWRTDDGAALHAHHVFDAAALVPQVAAPHSPANSASVNAYDNQRVDTAYIGACTGAKLEDLRMAARILRGRTVAPGMRLLVAPASLQAHKDAQAEGTLAALTDAGAHILSTGCGACAGYGQFRFAENERVISSTARNFKGRMGADSCRVWLGSPYTVAASAVTGRITDPRSLLEERA
jgi:3-isopropylmalate/(R)-2-methylmalate dehydratase large subunit